MPVGNHKKRRLEFLSLDCAYHCEITRSKSLRHTSHSSGHFFWSSCLPTSLSNESCISKRCFAQTLVVSVLAFKIKRYSAFDKVSPYSANQLTQGYDLRGIVMMYRPHHFQTGLTNNTFFGFQEGGDTLKHQSTQWKLFEKIDPPL